MPFALFLLALLVLPVAACTSSAPARSAEDAPLASSGDAPTASAVLDPAARVTAFDPAAAEVVTARIDTETGPVRLVRVLGDLRQPWGLAFLPDGKVLVTEKAGTLSLVHEGQAVAVAGVPEVWENGQGGLLDVVPHPEFVRNRLLYLTLSVRGTGGGGTQLVRGRFVDEGTRQPRLDDVQVLYTLPRFTDRGQHFGSRIAFLSDGTLLMTIGDRGEMERAQDRGDAAGSTLRLTADGRIPTDNPFVGQQGMLPEVYSYGHRNIQGIAYDRETGIVWASEHGPQGGDELNMLHGGQNYGWPLVSYGVQYRSGEPIGTGRQTMDGVQDVVAYWSPALAPSGTAVYRGAAFPAWTGNVLIGSLTQKAIVRVATDGERMVSRETIPVERAGRVRDVRVGPDGFVYLVSDERSGGVYRLEPAR